MLSLSLLINYFENLIINKKALKFKILKMVVVLYNYISVLHLVLIQVKYTHSIIKINNQVKTFETGSYFEV